MDVLLVSQHAAQRDSLTVMLREAFAGVAVHQAHGHAQALAELRRAKQLRLVLLDLAVNGSTGIEKLADFRERYPSCRIVAFSGTTEDRGLILSALHAGAAGYLSKQCAREVRLAALRLVAAGGIYLPPDLLPQQVRVPVTTRQRDVLRLLLKGYSNQRIAFELEISESTVKQHAYAVYNALGVSSRAQLLATAARRGIQAD